MNFNKVILAGRLANEIELKTTPSGATVCTFSLATSKSWKDKAGQKQEQVQFHKVVAWNKVAEILAQFAVKGQVLLIEGRLENRSWETKSGGKGYATEVIAETMQLGQKPLGSSSAQTSSPKAPIADDDIPIINDEDEGPKIENGPEEEKEPEQKKSSPKKKVLEAEDIDVKDITF